MYRVQSSFWRLPKLQYWPPPPLHPASVSFPRTKGVGGYTLAGRWGGVGPVFRKTPDIGLASYSIIPLRCTVNTYFTMYIGPRGLLFSVQLFQIFCCVWMKKVFENCLRNMEAAKMFILLFCLSTVRELSCTYMLFLKLGSVTFTTFHIYIRLNSLCWK